MTDPDQYLADAEARRQEMREEWQAAPAPLRPALARRFQSEMAQETRQARRAMTEAEHASATFHAQAALLRSKIVEVGKEGGRFIEAVVELELRGLAVVEDYAGAPAGAATFALTPSSRAYIEQWRSAVKGGTEPDVDGLSQSDVEILLMFEESIDDEYRFFVTGVYG